MNKTNIAVIKNEDENTFWDRLEILAKLIFIFFDIKGPSDVASNQNESPIAKVEGRGPRTTANLNPCDRLYIYLLFHDPIDNIVTQGYAISVPLCY